MNENSALVSGILGEKFKLEMMIHKYPRKYPKYQRDYQFYHH